MRSLIYRIFPLSGWPVAVLVILTQILSSYLVNLLSYNTLYRLYPFFRSKRFEHNGDIYQRFFRIRSWKEYVPAVGVFDKKNLRKDLNREYVSQYLLESLRAELCHGYAIIFAIVLIFLTVDSANPKIILWAVMLNAPCIMIQRYNRPRFERLLRSHGLAVFWTSADDGKRRIEKKKKEHKAEPPERRP